MDVEGEAGVGGECRGHWSVKDALDRDFFLTQLESLKSRLAASSNEVEKAQEARKNLERCV